METASTVLPWRQTIPPDHLEPNPDNPRSDPGDIEGLAQSIRKLGLKQPLLVTPVPGRDGYFWIEEGWRRWLAMRDWSTAIPCVVYPPLPGENTSVRNLFTALVTDAHRKGLNQIERAHGFGRLRDEFGLTATEIAGQVGLSVSTVTNSLMLLELDPRTQKLVADKIVSPTDVTRMIRDYRAKQRKKAGQKPKAPVWEPDWFTARHPVARTAVSLCNSRQHNARRRIGRAKNGGFPGACGECWQNAVEKDYELVLLAAGWTPPPGRNPS